MKAQHDIVGGMSAGNAGLEGFKTDLCASACETAIDSRCRLLWRNVLAGFWCCKEWKTG
jgi:hypothetical protein